MALTNLNANFPERIIKILVIKIYTEMWELWVHPHYDQIPATK